MRIGIGSRVSTAFLCAILTTSLVAAGTKGSWNGSLRDESGNPIREATVRLHLASGRSEYTAQTSAGGQFVFREIGAGTYELVVENHERTWKLADPVVIKDGTILTTSLQLSWQKEELHTVPAAVETSPQATGGEDLSSGKVSSLPLNARDFSKLLLLAAGTMTDANGAANFTQQFAVNGQRGIATVFAIDGFDTTDPEMGGATFSNFNVDAIQEVQASTGVIPAEIGHGPASFTNVVTKSVPNQVHGSA